jgi:GntR family transcriptional repressor for pyruvate dehydrogenase complex
MIQDIFSPTILQYIVDRDLETRGGKPIKLPPLDKLAKELGVSRGKLREDLIAARAYGMVDMRPGDGTYVQPCDFYTAIRTLVLYSIMCDKKNFDRFYRLRIQLEMGFWEEATANLRAEDKQELERILERAEQKLKGTPVEIPHRDHRDFHQLIYSRLDNVFAVAILRAYWDAYEAVGLHRYFDYGYYEAMWESHSGIVRAILEGRYREGKDILVGHFTLLEARLHGVPKGA